LEEWAQREEEMRISRGGKAPDFEPEMPEEPQKKPVKLPVGAMPIAPVKLPMFDPSAVPLKKTGGSPVKPATISGLPPGFDPSKVALKKSAPSPEKPPKEERNFSLFSFFLFFSSISFFFSSFPQRLKPIFEVC
jgi:hypothetical protein